MSPTTLLGLVHRGCFFLLQILWRPLARPRLQQGQDSDEYRVSARIGREMGELVSLAFAVCLALFLTKGLIAYRDLANEEMPPQIVDDGLFFSLGRIWVCCAEDFAVGLGCLFVAAVVLSLRKATWYRRGVRVLAHLLAAFAICYMVVNAQIYHAIHRFLTLSLFELGGGFKPERSIYEYATLTVKAALAMLPLLTIALHLAFVGKFPRFWRGVSWCVCRPAVLLLSIAGLAVAADAAQNDMFPQHNSDFAQNPHLLLARSFFEDLSFGDLEDDGPGDSSDFLAGDPGPAAVLPIERPTNVILIVLECGASQYFQTHGYPLKTTPCLAKLQDRSLTFEQFYATANHTIASALPLFGSTYNDPRTLSTVVEYPRFPVPFAQTWLQQQGYKTYFLGAGGHRAWEEYRNLASAFLPEGFDLNRDPEHPFWKAGPKPGRFLDKDYLDPEVFADARRVLQGAKGEKFFLFLWNYSTHSTYYADPREGEGPTFDESYFPPAVLVNDELHEDFKRYLRTLWQADKLIGNLYAELEKQGLAEDTLVVVTGDHGEAFGQHGCLMHGDSLYDEEIRVPLILINPRLASLGKRSHVLGSHIDVWPTIADVCGFPIHPHWQGRSLLSDLPEDQRRAYFARRGALGVREGNLKYIWDYKQRKDFLFDLEADPGERTNLAGNHPSLCLTQRRRLRDWTFFQSKFTRERLPETDD